MRLQDYLITNNLTPAKFSEIVGVSPSMIYRLSGASRHPSPALMKRIARATRGQVMPNDFVDLSDVEGMSEGSNKELPSV